MKAIVLIVLSILFFGIACGAKSNSGKEKRKISVTLSDHDILVDSLRISTTTKDLIQFKFTTDILPRFVLRYFSKSTDSIEGVAARWALWKIIEYSGTNATAGFTPGEDTINSECKFWQQTWTQLNASKETDPNTGITVYSVCTEVVPPLVRGNFRCGAEICASISDEITKHNRTVLDPNSVKWSFAINNYPYTQAGTYLALKTSFDTKSRVILLNSTAAAEVDDQAEGIELGPGALATWLQEVNITGAGCPATAQVVRSAYHNGTWADDNDESTYTDISDSVSAAFTATRTIVYHSFIPDAACQPNSIFWDPAIGMEGSDSESNDTVNAGSSLSVSIATVVFALLAALFKF